MNPVALFQTKTRFYTVSVDASASYSDVPLVSYEWDFGDGTGGTGVTATHTYEAEGEYLITLVVTDADGATATAVWMVAIFISSIQIRLALETISSPFDIPLNPSPVHDHDSVYIYRILPEPLTMSLTFISDGLSYVEVFDADNDRFLLPEKTEITEDTTFHIDWDGTGVFEVRVWKDSHVTRIQLEFEVPEQQRLTEVEPIPDVAPWVLVFGLAAGGMLGAWGRWRR